MNMAKKLSESFGVIVLEVHADDMKFDSICALLKS